MSFVALGTWYGLSAGWIAAVRYLLFVVVVVVVLLLAVRLFYKRSEQQQQSSCPIILCNNVEPHLLKELLFPPSTNALQYVPYYTMCVMCMYIVQP